MQVQYFARSTPRRKNLFTPVGCLRRIIEFSLPGRLKKFFQCSSSGHDRSVPACTTIQFISFRKYVSARETVSAVRHHIICRDENPICQWPTSWWNYYSPKPSGLVSGVSVVKVRFSSNKHQVFMPKLTEVSVSKPTNPRHWLYRPDCSSSVSKSNKKRNTPCRSLSRPIRRSPTTYSVDLIYYFL